MLVCDISQMLVAWYYKLNLPTNITLTSINTCWTLMKTKQWMSTVRLLVAHFSSGDRDTGSPPLVHDFHKHGMQVHVHCWQKYKANNGDCDEKILFYSWEFGLSNSGSCALFSCCSLHGNRKEALFSEHYQYFQKSSNKYGLTLAKTKKRIINVTTDHLVNRL